MSKYDQYLEIKDSMSLSAAARELGVDRTTIVRWKRYGRPDPQHGAKDAEVRERAEFLVKGQGWSLSAVAKMMEGEVSYTTLNRWFKGHVGRRINAKDQSDSELDKFIYMNDGV